MYATVLVESKDEWNRQQINEPLPPRNFGKLGETFNFPIFHYSFLFPSSNSLISYQRFLCETGTLWQGEFPSMIFSNFRRIKRILYFSKIHIFRFCNIFLMKNLSNFRRFSELLSLFSVSKLASRCNNTNNLWKTTCTLDKRHTLQHTWAKYTLQHIPWEHDYVHLCIHCIIYA